MEVATPPDQTGPAIQPMPEGQSGPGVPAQIGQPTNEPAATQPHVPNEDLNTGAVHSGEIARQIKPDRWEQLRGFLKHGVEAGLGRAEEWASEQDQKLYDRFTGQPKISAEQANKLFPNMPQSFSEPIDPLVAQMQWNYSHRMQKIQEWNSAGGPAPWTEFGTNLVTGFVDPINVAASALTGGASKALGITSSLRNTVLENLATNIALVPVERHLVGEMHLPKASSDEELKSVVTGTLVGSGIHMIMGHLFKSELDRVKNLPVDVRERALREVIAQNEVGSRPDASRAESEGAARARGEMEGQGSQARFNPIQNASEAPHYAAKDAAGKNLNPSGQELGSGTVAVRDGAKANHLAANPGGDSGRVGVYEIPKTSNLLDLEQTVSSEQAKPFVEAMEKELGFKLTMPGDTLLDVMSRLPNPAERDRAQRIAESLGYEGYQVLNGEKPQDGFVHLFDENAQPKDSVEANPEIVPRSSEEAKKQAFLESTSPETKKTYTPELAQEIHEFHKGPPLNAEFTPDYMDPIVKEQYDQAVQGLKEFAKNDAELAAELKEEGLTSGESAPEKVSVKEIERALKPAIRYVQKLGFQLPEFRANFIDDVPHIISGKENWTGDFVDFGEKIGSAIERGQNFWMDIRDEDGNIVGDITYDSGKKTATVDFEGPGGQPKVFKLKDRSSAPTETEEALKALKHSEAIDRQEAQAVKDLANCLNEGMS